jgi:hypothetical protein
MKTTTDIIEELDKGELNLSDITNREFIALKNYAKVNRKTLEKYGNKVF